jgi:hypothetical protein
MKSITTILLSILYLNSVSQSDKKCIIGITFSPIQSYRTLKASDDYGKAIVNSRNTSEVPIASFSAGITGTYFVTKKIGLSTGLLYTQRGHGTKPIFLPDSINVTTGQFYYSSTNYWFNYKVNYFDIPIKVCYLFLDKKIISLHASAGIINNIFLNQKTIEYKNQNGAVSQTTGNLGKHTKSYSLSWVISAGIDFNIKKIKIRIEPSFDRFILSANGDNIKTYYYNKSLSIGVYYILSPNNKK